MTPQQYQEAVAGEVRAEMARQRKSRADLAVVLGVTPATAARRFEGVTPFDVTELLVVASWLGIPLEQLATPGDAQTAVPA